MASLIAHHVSKSINRAQRRTEHLVLSLNFNLFSERISMYPLHVCRGLKINNSNVINPRLDIAIECVST